jgi:hypothetical protein
MRQTSNVRLATVMALLVASWTFSCIHAGSTIHVDYLLGLEITGRVLDEGTGIGIDEVDLLFVDTGLDYVRMETGTVNPIGTSGPEGEIDASFTYLWGRMQKTLESLATGTFSIELRKSGYRARRFDFTWPGDSSPMPIELGSIALERL